MYKKVFICSLVLLNLAIAGTNSGAKLFADAVGGTSAVDSIGGCPSESSFVAAVRITDASKLYSYEFYLKFDTASLKFVSGKRGNDNEVSFLEKNDGSASFTAKISKQDSTRVLVGNFLLGDDDNQCVSGEGLLGLFTFTHKKADTTDITIESVKLIDCELEEDTGLGGRSATIVPVSEPVVYMRRPHTAGGPQVSVRQGVVTVAFARRTNWELSTVNTLGRCLDSRQGYGQAISYACAGRTASVSASGVLFVKVRYDGNSLVVPVMR